MRHEDPTSDDQVAAGRGPGGPTLGERSIAGLLLEVQPQGLHSAPTVCCPGPQDLPQDRLPGCRRLSRRLRRTPGRRGTGEGARSVHPLLRQEATLKKGAFVVLLLRATTSAVESGLIAEKPT